MLTSTAALIQNANRFLFVKRPPGGDLGERWELPGGKVDPGESAGAALGRELQEELGIESTIGEQVASSRFAHQGKAYRLLAFQVEADLENMVLNEHTDKCWCTLREALEIDLAPSDRDLIRSMIGPTSQRLAND